MAGLNVIDIIIIIIFLSSMFVGFGRGLVSEVISLGSLIVSVIVAVLFSQQLASYIMHTQSVQNLIHQASASSGIDTTQSATYIALGISFLILFVGTMLICTIIGQILNAAFQVTLMGIGNRLLGAGFGFIRGFVICLILIFLIQLSPFGDKPLWRESRLVASFQPSVQWLANIVSPALANLKDRATQQLQGVTRGLTGS